jgi:hypothetical protein
MLADKPQLASARHHRNSSPPLPALLALLHNSPNMSNYQHLPIIFYVL